MNPGAYFLGLDISTTAVKALLMDDQGQTAGAASAEYGYDTPHPLWSEQDPALWWDGTLAAVRGVLQKTGIAPEAVAAIGLTGQMHGLVLLNEAGEVLRPAILWNDQRTGRQCDAIRDRLGRENLIQLTGNDALPGFTAPKILWVRENEPFIWQQVRHILLPKDYVRFRLTGFAAVDAADGSGTILFNLQRRSWSHQVLEALEIPEEIMPPVFEGTSTTGLLSREAAEALGLPANIPVAAGGGDQSAAAVGCGAVEPGILSISLGTSGVVFAPTAQPVIEPQGRLHAFCHAAPNLWHLMGVMLSAAGSLRWLRDTLAPGRSYDDLTALAAQVQPGSEGVLFLPYLTGERTPVVDPLARGAFTGLSVRHGLGHLTRAVLEGVAFGLRGSYDLMKDAGLAAVNEIRITGGGARSPLWRQIIADVLGCGLVTVNTEEGAAYGAALLAAVGAGVWVDVPSACRAVVRVTESTTPDAERSAFYEHQYARYRQLYPALKPLFT